MRQILIYWLKIKHKFCKVKVNDLSYSIEEIKEYIKVNRKMNKTVDAALDHCPFPNCIICAEIFNTTVSDFSSLLGSCPCHIFGKEYVQKRIHKLIGDL